MSNLLLDEHPLLVMPKLATKIGLNEAIVLQQVHYWIEIERKTKDTEVIQKHFHNGKWYVFNTYEQWHEQFPFWSLSTLKRIIASLEKRKLLISDNFNRFGYDRTKWYTIDYKVLEDLENQESVKMTQWNASKCTNAKYQNDTTNTIDYPLTTSKEYIKCTMVQKPSVCTTDYSYDVVEKQIRKICELYFSDVDANSIIDIVLYYCNRYEKYFYKHHPKLKNEHFKRIIKFISQSDYGTDIYKDLIDKHFDTKYGKSIDFNMLHFFTEGIIENRSYECL